MASPVSEIWLHFSFLQKRPKFPFEPWTIVHGGQKIELAQKIHASRLYYVYVVLLYLFSTSFCLFFPPLSLSLSLLVLESDIETLTAMLLASRNQRIPLLVLSCLFQANNEQSSLPSLDVADKLKLIDISNPWQVIE